MFFVDKKLLTGTRGTFADFYCNKKLSDAALQPLLQRWLDTHQQTHTDAYTGGSWGLSGDCRSLPAEEPPGWTVAHAKVDPSSTKKRRVPEVFS